MADEATPLLDRVRIVLVEPKQAGNIGSISRAMRNSGLSRLVLVNPGADHTSGDARKMAVGAGDILYGATVVGSLEEAVEDSLLVVGTSHKTRKDFPVIFGPGEVSSRLLSIPNEGEGALVFGREERGLTNREIQLCQLITQIPSARKYPSYNLSQAVLIFGYELHKAALNPREVPNWDIAPVGQVEAMYRHLAQSLDNLGFKSPHRPETFIRSVRRFFGRIPLEKRDISTIHRICRQVDRFIGKHGIDIPEEPGQMTGANEQIRQDGE
ncbi:RNA methyltransferase [bacterium]|nr:RNA methyltransferase [bacterium]